MTIEQIISVALGVVAFVAWLLRSRIAGLFTWGMPGVTPIERQSEPDEPNYCPDEWLDLMAIYKPLNDAQFRAAIESKPCPTIVEAQDAVIQALIESPQETPKPAQGRPKK